MKAVMFDLDDTLYPEIDFVKSGFRAVARYLSARHKLAEESLYDEMMGLLQAEGRGKVFDRLLDRLGLSGEVRVNVLLYLYRAHPPAIRLYEDVLPVLEHLRRREIRLGMITDGMGSVQRRKISSLGLDKLFDVTICTDELGREHWKPSPAPFEVALDLLQVVSSESVYVGDDPGRDFLGPNSIGALTIQVNRRMDQGCICHPAAEPASPGFIVKGLAEILPIIERQGLGKVAVERR